jgi:hypothetical protein
MRHLLLALCTVFAFGRLTGQQTVWQPSPGHIQLPIGPVRVPDPQPVAVPEVGTTSKELGGGRPVVSMG